MTGVTRAWLWLIGLSAGSTLVAAAADGITPRMAVLALAFAKARIILRAYLGLHAAPTIARGFDLVLGLFVLALAGLALAGLGLAAG